MLQMQPQPVAPLTLRLHFTAVRRNHVFHSPFNVAVKPHLLNAGQKISAFLLTHGITVSNHSTAPVLASFHISAQMTVLVKDPQQIVLVQEFVRLVIQLVQITAACLVPTRSQTVLSYQPVF